MDTAELHAARAERDALRAERAQDKTDGRARDVERSVRWFIGIALALALAIILMQFETRLQIGNILDRLVQMEGWPAAR